jgi:hypothetical protein
VSAHLVETCDVLGVMAQVEAALARPAAEVLSLAHDRASDVFEAAANCCGGTGDLAELRIALRAAGVRL